jgi:CheY-like chemotaxis protein
MNEVRILVVDDEPVTRMITESVLAAQGFIVEAAESAEWRWRCWPTASCRR